MQVPFKLGENEQFVQCPYEKSHLISNLRFLVHLDKCRRNYLKKAQEAGKPPDIKHCRFNDAHRYPEIEMSYHEANCRDQYAIVKHIQNMQHLNKVKAEQLERKSLDDDEDEPEPRNLPKQEHTVDDEEDWDKETDDYRPGYDPTEKLKNEAIMYIPRGLTKSERKKWRIQNREKFADFEPKQEVKEEEEEYEYHDEHYDDYGRRIGSGPSKHASSSKREVDSDYKDCKVRKVEY
jgi:hypothetical protein